MFFWNSLGFLSDPADVGNMISGFSAFSKSSFYIWKFLVQVLLSHGLNDFEHYLDSMWNAQLDEAQAGIKIAGEISTISDMQMIPL